MKEKSKIIYSKNESQSMIQNSGYISNKERFEMFTQAGKRLQHHRINSELIDLNGEQIERSIFGLKRYVDKLDVCELIKRNKDKVNGIMSTYSLRKAEEAAEKAKADEAEKASLKASREAMLNQMVDDHIKSQKTKDSESA